MAFNKDEMHAPQWMDDAFFEKVLKQSENDSDLSVSESKLIPGTKPGDHFASVIFRAKVTYNSRGESREISLIIKTIPAQEGIKKDLLKGGEIFGTETIMYQTVIPEMVRLLRSVGDNTEFGPRLMYSSNDPSWVMVFEDITKRDYQMKDHQLNLDDAKIVYTKLARWHAASLVLSDSVPIIPKLDNSIASAMQADISEMWIANIAMLATLCRGWPGYETYGDRLDSLKDTIITKIKDIFQLKDSNLYNVLNHGDLHYKNMMFKIEDSDTKDILLLDYQLSFWGTPACDIIYSLYNTCSIETRANHRDELIKFYHDEFTATLNKLGYMKKIPTLVDLQVEVLKCGYLETFLSCTFLPILIAPFEELMSTSAIEEGFELDFGNKELMLHIFQHPKYVSVIQRYLPALLHRGLLE
ncbi:uncharacterized protein LOC134212583 [Armigeres subalbatus]|uniref:uncharacterized protein LOC134212583 n=1 Tax=Armigeres subalbatus TaxID=124917 RepID=UPI002ED4B7AD